MIIKKIVYFGFIIISIFVINELAHSIYSLWQKNSLIDQTRQALNVQKKRNSQLKENLKLVNQTQFVEQEARNKLFLARPGEGMVVIAPTQYMPANQAKVQEKSDSRPNWQKWRDLFF